MVAVLLLRERLVLTETAFVEMVVWRLPLPKPGRTHTFKYRLALVAQRICVLRYDNETGKGDHRHLRKRETRYRFTAIETLQRDFWTDVETWRRKR
ncbi:MAG: DUF6516 family protein [Pseudomonadota bacterium]|nr:DUF6516 family protein [Pseudomonadota bacterium]